MTNDHQIDLELVHRVLVSAAPERESEIDQLLADIKPTIHLLPDGPGLCLQANGAKVEFTNKTLRALWLLGFTGWRVFRAYGPAIFVSNLSRQELPAVLSQDSGFDGSREAFETLLHALHWIKSAPTAGDVEWPAGIPEPVADRAQLSNREDIATFDLVMIATAYAFLHELRHVWHYRQTSRPAHLPDEEIDCDVFARAFLMSKAGAYAESIGQPVDQVTNKRAMAIALGAWTVYELTPEPGRAGTDTHPPFADRFEALIANMPIKPDGDFWIWACSLLAAALRNRGKVPGLKFDDPQMQATTLIGELRRGASTTATQGAAS